MTRIALRKRLARTIKRGHPWIYRDAIVGAPALADGTVVVVAGDDDAPLARGYWDARSPIAVRLLGPPVETPVGDVVTARVAAALARRLAFIDLAQTNAFRWIHGEADELPGVHVDVYGRALALRYDGGGARAFYRELPNELVRAAEHAGIAVTAIVERRARRATAADGGDAAAVVWGTLPAGEIEVRENGLRFGADLVHGQKGGLFLDQRDNRALVRTLAAGRRVLNLFAYTGGFSVYAAAGGAREVVTVDVAAPAVAAAERNFARNGLPTASARFVAEDAFAFLEGAARRRAQFDLVVSDPPSFAPNRRALAAGLRAYRRLHRLCARVVAPGGILCAASCSSHVDRRAFLASVEQGARDAGRRFSLREMRGAAADHPVAARFPEGDYLKMAVGVVSGA